LAKPPKWPPNCEITREDLQHLRALHQLLLALNDPLVSRSKLQMLTASMPVLAARIIHQAKAKWPATDSLSDALQRVGNRGLERALLEFLEDLTIFKADLEEKQKPKGGAEASAQDVPVTEAPPVNSPSARPATVPTVAVRSSTRPAVTVLSPTAPAKTVRPPNAAVATVRPPTAPVRTIRPLTVAAATVRPPNANREKK
jgi:hypothetical protein